MFKCYSVFYSTYSTAKKGDLTVTAATPVNAGMVPKFSVGS